MKRLVICCDGTWNTPDQESGGVPTPTNVVRLYNAVAAVDAGGVAQERYYHPGVGTEPGLLSRLAGGSLGLGLDKNIMSAYRRLCEGYQAGDDLFLFGFSRGAYTVRSLAGMVGRCGLLDLAGLSEKESWARIERAFERGYRARKTGWAKAGWAFLAPPEGRKKVPIRFLGVWDTVGALGIPDEFALLNLIDSLEDHEFHDTALGDHVASACHVLALDELRASFQPTLWTGVEAGRDMRQVWFPGNHSDVGGGHRETGLSDGALLWMMGEAEARGLVFDPALKAQVRANFQDVLHDPAKGLYGLLPTQPRSAPRLDLDAADLHASARERFKSPPIAQAPYRPTRVLAPGESARFDVFARDAWNTTGLYLEAGVAYTLAAEGEWVDGTIRCGPGGTKDGKFEPAEVAHLVGSAIGQAEEWFKKVSGNRNADFLMTRRHEDAPWFCLMGVVANSAGSREGKPGPHETVAIGNGRDWTPTRSGYLYAYANDAWRFYANNRGHVSLTVTRAA